MEYSIVKEKLERFGQGHLLKFYDELGQAEKERFLEELNDIDFSVVNINTQPNNGGIIEPIDAVTMEETEKHEGEFRQAGIEAIREGKVACVLLAGGQGTRLGIDGPKGAFNVGETRELFIFECLINNLMDVTQEAGTWIPLLVMTSDKNDAETRKFFEDNYYFGYDRSSVQFFVQEMAPATDYEGRVYLEEKGHVALSPNGNGGWFKSLKKAGLVDTLKEMGIEWINVFAVDNVLQRMADPLFIGATIKSGKPIGSKVVGKASPEEKVGVMCIRDGKPSIVEYYELTEAMSTERTSDGRLAYNWGVILNYLLNLKELIRIENLNMPLHIVEKKIPYVDENGMKVKPESPNGYKFETLILDMISMMDDCLVFEVDRNKEFAPIKNAEGKDSPDSARKLLKANGVEL